MVNFIADTTPQDILEAAIILATEKHAGQVDKGGMPYILHPLRVMMGVQRKYRGDTQDKAYWDMCTAAILHDVIEDTPTTYDELLSYGFSKETVDLVEILTKRPEENSNYYLLYIQRIIHSENLYAIVVKMSDLADNMNQDRLPKPLSEKDRNRIDKYENAHTLLSQVYYRMINQQP